MVYLVSFCLDLRIYDIDLSTVHFIIIIFNLIKHTYIKLNAFGRLHIFSNDCQWFLLQHYNVRIDDYRL